MNFNDYILCVDDDEDDCELLNEAIKSTGRPTSVKFFQSGEEAISFLTKAVEENHPPKLLILDINMPRMNGLQTMEEIRKVLPVFIPVLFLTTAPGDAVVTFSESNNASIMTKPSSATGYQSIVQTIFGSLID